MKKILQKVREMFGKVGMYAGTGVLAISNTTGEIPDGQTVTIRTLERWINTISNFMLTVGVVIAAIFIIWGGISFMMAGGNPEKATAAKTRLFNGIIGALIVLGVGLILKTINNLVLQGL